MRKFLLILVLLALAGAGGAYWWSGRGGVPVIAVAKPQSLMGQGAVVEVTVDAPGGRLSKLDVTFEQGRQADDLVHTRPGRRGRADAGRARSRAGNRARDAEGDRGSQVWRRRACSSPPSDRSCTASAHWPPRWRIRCASGWSRRASQCSRCTTTSITAAASSWCSARRPTTSPPACAWAIVSTPRTPAPRWALPTRPCASRSTRCCTTRIWRRR